MVENGILVVVYHQEGLVLRGKWLGTRFLLHNMADALALAIVIMLIVRGGEGGVVGDKG